MMANMSGLEVVVVTPDGVVVDSPPPPVSIPISWPSRSAWVVVVLAAVVVVTGAVVVVDPKIFFIRYEALESAMCDVIIISLNNRYERRSGKGKP